MPYTIHTAKAKIKDAQNHYRSIDVFSGEIEETQQQALAAIASAQSAATTAVQTIADNINTSTANQLTDASAVANMVAQEFVATNTYKKGDYVRYTTTSNDTTINTLYCLTADHAADVTWANTSKVEVKLSNDVNDLKSASYKYTGNMLDFGFVGGTWEQGGYGNTNPYQCRTKKISVTAGNTLYGVVNGTKMARTSALSSYTIALYVVFLDSSDAKIGNEVNISNSSGQSTGSVTIPNNCTNVIAFLSSGVYGNQFTPSTLDNAVEAFAYIGYDNIAYTNVQPNYVPYPAYNDTNIQTLQTAVAPLGEKVAKTATYKRGETPVTLTSAGGYYKTDGTLYDSTSSKFLHYDVSVNSFERYEISSLFNTDSRFVAVIFFNAAGGVVSYIQASSDGVATIVVSVPYGAVKMGINNYYNNTPYCYPMEQEDTETYIQGKISPWQGKKIVWFGTSIPAGVVNAGASNGNGSYPIRIGEAVGATVYNEAVGSSCARGGDYQSISADDPMGWSGMSAISVMLSLSLSSAEKQDIIDDWDTKWKDIIGDPNTYDSTATATYLAASWDVKLSKYLTGGSVGQCDLYVFDHGYNDFTLTSGFSKLDEIPATQNDRTYWFGAMSYLTSKILEDNPKAKILIIGHYNYGADAFNRGANYKGSYVCDAQKAYAELWGVSCVETWKLLGLTSQTITVNGATKTMIEARYPDKLHPASDSTGYELKRYAEALLPYINMAAST